MVRESVWLDTTAKGLGVDNKTKTLCSFEFVKVGSFSVTESTLTRKHNGKDEELSLLLNLVDQRIRSIGESAYLLYADDELMYVGEYSRNLADRWLVNTNYVWHHKDIDILAAIKRGRTVSMWLTTDPYLPLVNNQRMNVSKSIEQQVLKTYDIPWNKRGLLFKDKKWIEKNCIDFSSVYQALLDKETV